MQAMSTAASGVRHALLALTEALLIATIVAALLLAMAPVFAPAHLLTGAEPALAAKGGNSDKSGSGKAGGGKETTSTITLYVLDGDDAVPNHRERVGFDVSTTATDSPFVGVRCWQGTYFVLDGYTGYFETYSGNPWVTLSSPYWQPGVVAECTARLFHYDKRGNQKVLATLDFVAEP